MEDQHETTPGEDAPEAVDTGIYGEDGVILAPFLAQVGAAIADRDTLALKRDVGDLHQSELGDLLEALLPEQRRALVELLGKDFDFSSLTEVDEAIRLDIVDNLPNEQIAQAVQELDSDDAVYILEDLDQEDQDEILAQLPFTERIRLRRSLDYPEESAGRRMQTEFVAVPPFWTVGQTIDYMREDKNLPDRFSQIFVIDPTFKLLGAIDLDQVLRTKRGVKVEEIMHETRHAIPATMDQEEAAREFEQYDLLSAAVVDENERLVGVLTIDDVVDVIQQEAEEDLMRMGGVGDEELSELVHDDIARPLAVADGQSRHGHSGFTRHRPVRCNDPADGGAGGADADCRIDGRQCRNPDHDRYGARAGDQGYRYLQCQPHHPP